MNRPSTSLRTLRHDGLQRVLAVNFDNESSGEDTEFLVSGGRVLRRVGSATTFYAPNGSMQLVPENHTCANTAVTATPYAPTRVTAMAYDAQPGMTTTVSPVCHHRGH